ncbi:alpha/beta fold hydrolase [Cryobacterium sp. N21]|uniref:alpha/beta fold hydrolase n=1 Tax=Cryobacterium sp. N21 TaxID=2048289 RepID=UPI000CE30A16|nr:alpha/beta hydrolase [Cryobacterium sp. N21]
MIKHTEGYATAADGEMIWYETAGSGPDLILSHGLGGNAATWYQQVPYFAQRYRVITWDQRGFGRSGNLQKNHGPASAVKDLIMLMDTLEVEKADLVGQSMGGWVTLGTAIAVPDRVRSIVLACTTAGIPVKFSASDTPIAPSTSMKRGLGEHPAIGGRLQSLDLARAYLYQALGSFGHRPPDDEFFRILQEFTFKTDALKSFRGRALLIAGELDVLMTPERIRSAARYLSAPTVVEMSDRGHSPYFEDPQPWNDLVAKFLKNELRLTKDDAADV